MYLYDKLKSGLDKFIGMRIRWKRVSVKDSSSNGQRSALLLIVCGRENRGKAMSGCSFTLNAGSKGDDKDLEFCCQLATTLGITRLEEHATI